MTAFATPDLSAIEDVDPRNPYVRLATLLDEGTVSPLQAADAPDTYDRAGVVAARGTIDGSPVVAFCTDATIMGGAMGHVGCAHIVSAIDTALEEGVPCIGLWHSGGARLAEGVEALHGVGLVFHAMVRASGKIPQISVVLGAAAGGAAYGPALTDVVIMAPESKVFVTGPDVVRQVTGETVTQAELGGPTAHHRKSGVCHIASDSEGEAYETARDLATLFSQQGVFNAEALRNEHEDIGALFPDSARRAYDVHPIVDHVVDARENGSSSFVELQSKWAPSIVVGYGRLAGRTVGIIANNPLRLGGCLNSESAEKAARFVRMADAFGIPLVVLVDVPGYLPGVAQEWDGVVRRGAKLLHAFSEAKVARVTLVTRKIYGGAYIAMNSMALGASAVYAWPNAEVAVMGAKAAVGILHKRALAAAPEEEREALHERLAEEHSKISGGVGRAMDIGVVDEVISPAETRYRIASTLALAPHQRGEHNNIPL